MLPNWVAKGAVYGIALIAGLGTIGYLILKRPQPEIPQEFEEDRPTPQSSRDMEVSAPDIPEPDNFVGDEIPTVGVGPLAGTPPSGPPIERVVPPALDFLI